MTRGAASILLLHGLMGSGRCWTPLARALQGEFDLVMPDARGHGGAPATEGVTGYDDLADDVLELVEDLQLTQPVLVGHSMGGMTAALAASRCPGTLRGLVLLDPTFISPERQRQVWESDVAAHHRRALSQPRSVLVAEARARHPHRSLEVIELQVEARLNTRPTAFEVLRPPNPDFRAVVRAIDVPTLLLIGDAPVVSLELAHELCGINPLIRVEQIAGAGHGLHFDQTEAAGQAILDFLHGLG